MRVNHIPARSEPVGGGIWLIPTTRLPNTTRNAGTRVPALPIVPDVSGVYFHSDAW